MIRTLLPFFILLISALSFTQGIDDHATRLTSRGFSRALVAFATARGLNGVISVAQGTEFAIEPGGVGIVFTPGEILDPINDLVERFSWVMLAACTSLGLQRLLLNMVSQEGIRVFVGLAFVVLSVALWWCTSEQIRKRLCKITFALLVLRFGIATIAVSGEMIFPVFLKSNHDTALNDLESTKTKLTTLNLAVASSAGQARDVSALDWLTEKVTQLINNLDVNSRMEQYEAAVETMSESAIELVVIFLFQTILVPIGLLFGLLSITRSVLKVE